MRYHLVVTGLVQGVGFRPFVEREAKRFGLTGSVLNSGGAVHIVVRADLSVVQKFMEHIRNNAPRGSMILDISVEAKEEQRGEPGEKKEDSGFFILPSDEQNRGYPILPPDVSVCEDCIREMEDPKDRRYAYPFISCVSCGPRYSILNRIPYDRKTTTMDVFSMCPDCREEYGGTGRRHHAQTISCHVCGPQLIYWEGERRLEKKAAMEAVIRRIRDGGIVAAKGIGGYQYICRADEKATILRLRRIKGREEKPFAVMFPEQKEVEQYCICEEEERRLLKSSAAPIVLLKKRAGGKQFLDEVAGNSPYVGAFLPNTPFHVLLTKACGPLIVTSANDSGEPMIWKEEGDWKGKLSKADGIASHGRVINGPLDDSVTAVTDGHIRMIRRGRGYVPLPIWDLGPEAPEIFAAGGDLKACFALAAKDRIYPGTYLGDLESGAVQDHYRWEKERMERLLTIHPKIYVCDKHPGYFSSVLAKEWSRRQGLRCMEVQHHHAHAASVMAEHHLTHGIGVTFDGTGYGEDGTIWGGEFLLCRDETFTRMGYLRPVPICGGDASAKHAWQTAVCYLEEAGVSRKFWMSVLGWAEEKQREIALLLAARSQGIQTVPSSSMGRLFDAAAAILGIGTENGYEGACAVGLEGAAKQAMETGEAPYPLVLPMTDGGEAVTFDTRELIRACFQAVLEQKCTLGGLALGFHRAVAASVLEGCRRIREKTGECAVLLGGGVFANRILLEACIECLREDGFLVYWNQQVPGNDGGLAVGQAYLAKLKYGREETSCV